MDKSLLKEFRRYTDTMFQLSVVTMNCVDNNLFICHWHDELEFVLILDGTANIQVGTSYYELSAGQAIFINSGEIHGGRIIGNSSFKFCALIFDSSILSGNMYDSTYAKYIDPFIKTQVLSYLSIPGHKQWEKEIILHIQEIKRLIDEKPFSYEIAIKAYLFLLFYKLISNNRTLCEVRSRQDLNKTKRLRLVLDFIKNNYNRKISIQEVASMAHLSEGHFCCFFKQMTGKTFIEFVNFYRINKAAELLRNSDKKILEIAIDVGFDNFSYFINQFKRYMKQTPSEYSQYNDPRKQGDKAELC